MTSKKFHLKLLWAKKLRRNKTKMKKYKRNVANILAILTSFLHIFWFSKVAIQCEAFLKLLSLSLLILWIWKTWFETALREYSLIINKHNQELINILVGFLKISIFRVSLSRTHLQSKMFLFTMLQTLKIKIKTLHLVYHCSNSAIKKS